MKATNTVMDKKDIEAIVERYTAQDARYPQRYLIIARAQATISFVAGIREAVRWMKNNSFHSNSVAFHRAVEEGQVNIFNDRELQAQLKKWGIDGTASS